MLEIKGNTLLSRLTYMDQKGTLEQREEILKKLSPEFAKKILTDQVLPAAWYPGSYYVELHRAIDAILGKGDLALLPDIGAFSAEIAVKGLVKIFFKFGSPEYILKRATAIWRQHYSLGIMTPFFRSPTEVECVLTGIPDYPRELGLAVKGWIKRIIELSSNRTVTVNMQEFGPDFEQNVVYHISWK